MKTVALIGTFDTKGTEYMFIRRILEEQGLSTLTIHCGVFAPSFVPDVDHDVVARLGGGKIEEIAEKKDRGYAMEILGNGLRILVKKLYEKGLFSGILSLGGSGGTALAAPAMRELPIGVPKIMVSTMASSDVRRYVGTSDMIMIPSVVDVAGVNYISSQVFSNAAHAMAGMMQDCHERKISKKPMIAATMYGVTTPCVTMAKNYLEQHGFEVLVFHASGVGGQSMENLIRQGVIAGVLDLTTTEWCDELMGGVMAAGPERNEAAAKMGIPQVVSVGAMDMVTFGDRKSVPEKYKNRKLRMHNPMITIMRTTVEENIRLGEKLAEKLNMATNKTILMLPLKGVSMVDAKGQPFYGPEEDQALFDSLKEHITNDLVEILAMDAHINEECFAVEAARQLINLMKEA